MIWSREIHISSSIYTSSSPIFFLCRILGVAPFSIRKNGQNFILKWSLAYTIYSFILGFMFVYGSIAGLIAHLNLSRPKGEYVIYISIVLANIVSIFTVFGAPLRISSFYSYIESMIEIDEILKVNDSKKTRNISIAVLTIIILGITMQVFASMYFMALINPLNVYYLILHNIQQTYFLVIFESQYAHMVYCVQRRIAIINNCLKLKENSETHKEGTILRVRLSEAIEVERLDLKLRADISVDYGLKLAKVYSLLCDAVDDINSSFGYTVVMIIMNCLLKVTETMYFFIFMMLQQYPLGSLITQVFWTFFHLFRLLIIEEPCNMCLKEISNTSVQVTKLLGIHTNNRNIKAQMKIFQRHLQNRKIVFSVGGLGTLNHKFLTSFMAAVITYLVIIIQFNQLFNKS